MGIAGMAGRNGNGAEGRPDLADHFMECCKLGRHLTVYDDSRFVISDDFRSGVVVEPVATTVASLFSNDPLVAQAALLPLGKRAGRGDVREREKYEELFTLIEERALSGIVREGAQDLLEAGFKEARILAIESELGGKINPARKRYRDFLGVVRRLIDNEVSAGMFRDEFLDFTYAVAGKLDFGIYSFCLDRMFGHALISFQVKVFLVEEIVKYPSLLRRELLSNLLVSSTTDPRLTGHVRNLISRKLTPQMATEIYLLEGLRRSRMSIDEIEESLISSVEEKARAATALIFPGA